MENTTPICAMLVDTNVENEEEFEEVGRDQDVPPLTVSTNYISNTSEQLQMGSHSGMTNPIRCKKCTNCIMPTCIMDDKDIICVSCVVGQECMQQSVSHPCVEWARTQGNAVKTASIHAANTSTKILKSMGVNVKTIQTVDYVFKNDISSMIKSSSDLNDDQLNVMRAIVTLFPTAQLTKSTKFNTDRRDETHSTNTQTTQACGGTRPKSISTIPNTVTVDNTEEVTQWLAEHGMVEGATGGNTTVQYRQRTLSPITTFDTNTLADKPRKPPGPWGGLVTM